MWQEISVGMDWPFEAVRQLLSDQFGGDYPYGFTVRGQVPGSGSGERIDSEERWRRVLSSREMTLCLESYPAKKLGKGAYGEVRMVTEPSGAVFAVKQIQMDEHGRAESALKERQALEKLSHRNIVQYFSCVVMKGSLYLKMEYVPYKLEDRRSGRPHWSEPELKNVALQVLEGLKYLHGKQMAHRDIKESNLMVTEDGVYKLLDFGCAKRVEDVLGHSKLSYSGTPGYVAPEIFDPYDRFRKKVLAEMQASGGREGDPKDDEGLHQPSPTTTDLDTESLK